MVAESYVLGEAEDGFEMGVEVDFDVEAVEIS